MRTLGIRGAWFAAALAAVLVGGRAEALPFDLKELTDGSVPSFTVGDLTFSNFGANVQGALGADLSVFTLDVVGTDLQISGPFSVGAGELGQLTLQYSVTSSVPFAEASLTVNGSVTGGYAAVGEQWFDAQGTELAVTRVQLDPGEVFGSFTAPLPAGTLELRIQKEITLRDGASLTGPVVQGYALVPEPGTAFLAAAGLVGLALTGRRRS